MIVVVAPYSPAGSCPEPHLGASRKIEVVIQALSRVDPNVLLVNSAHNDLGWMRGRLRQRTIAGVNVTEMEPRRWPIRKIGKLLNLAGALFLTRKVASIGQPRMVWLYNPYAFESLAGRFLGRRFGCPVVLELEDSHFSRGVTVKSLIDYVFWNLCRSVTTHATVVNQSLGRSLVSRGVPITLLPGLIPDELVSATSRRSPFAEASALTVVGYFGGLNHEKGVGLLLEAIPRTRGRVKWLVTGDGPLAPLLAQLAHQMPDALEFRGVVSQAVLYDAIASCDIAINPHRSIVDMGDGVFPFKVVEAIAGGRLLLSTPLPLLPVDGLMGGVVEIDGSLEDLLSILGQAREIFLQRHAAIIRAQGVALRHFGRTMLDNVIRGLLETSRTANARDRFT